MPNVTKAQLENLTIELEKHKQITKAVFVYKDHNCLLVDLKTANVNSQFQYFYDLVKVIGISCGQDNLALKDEEAYQEIMDSGIDGNSNYKIMLMKKIFILFALFLITSYTKSQTTYLMSSVNVTLTCPPTYLFYDSGGSAGNYGNSQNLTKTFFCSSRKLFID